MSIAPAITNRLVKEGSGVWVLEGHGQFAYSDGAASERYLAAVLGACEDLSSGSVELEAYIRDWPSEYHLSRKRAQLLSGFTFDRGSRVLEVGCGCGAISRYLGETFDSVTAVEGSLQRARLARARTRDLPNVEVVCAPFQEISFAAKFDVIVCVGVFEYSAAFVSADDPHDAVLRYFKDLLTDDGIVVIAIENQFGLKYFGSSREDHLGVRFEGLEGYPARRRGVRTFGAVELEDRLRRHFPSLAYYYPYPDYKLPDCVVAHDLLASGRAGELISQMRSRDYAGAARPLWDEGLVSLELARNRMLPFFANSFLVVAGAGRLRRARFAQLAVVYSSGRRRQFSTITRVLGDPAGRMTVAKALSSGRASARSGELTLVPTESEWIDRLSLQAQLARACRQRSVTIGELFLPCRAWLRHLESRATTEAGTSYLDGGLVDGIWSNAYVERTECAIVDQEWVWSERLRLNVVVIRAIYAFLSRVERLAGVSAAIRGRNGRALIRRIGAAIGVRLSDADFAEFVRLESRLQALVFGLSERRYARDLRWRLGDRTTLRWALSLWQGVRAWQRAVSARLEGGARLRRFLAGAWRMPGGARRRD